ncbi:MAG: iron ABC transporter permease [Ruminococcus sp.]|jgi:iron complex transport system permease protein|nr:iron ABC transporter permease [Ruminococcus sp.]
MKTFPAWFKYLSSIIFAVVSVFFGIGIGSVFIPPDEILSIIFGEIFGLNLPKSITEMLKAIVLNVRLPRALSAFLVGAGLSAGGAVMQSVLANPLASGYTLGVSSGASLGVTIVVFFGVTLSFAEMLTLPIMGFVFGLGSVFIALSVAAKFDRNAGNSAIILIGMVMSLFINAIVTLLMGINREAAKSVIYWQMGSFSGVNMNAVIIIFPITFIIILLLIRYSRAMDIMTFGDEQALSLGVNVKATKILLLTLSAALTGVAVAFVGAIGFIDLIAPHAARKIFCSKHKTVIPMSALMGGGFMVISDLLARTVISPSELPVGAVTAIIGAPVFAYIFLKRSKNHA